MPTNIGDLSLRISSSADSATKGIDSLAASLTRLKSSLKGGLGLNSVRNQMEKLAAVSGGENLDKITALSTALNKLSGVSINAGIATQLNRVGKALGVLDRDHVNMLGDMVRDLKELSTLSNIGIPSLRGLSSSSTQAFNARNGALDQALDSGMQDATPASNERIRGTASETSALFEAVKNAAVKAGSAIASFFRDVVDNLRPIVTFAQGVKKAIQGVISTADKIRHFGGLLGKTHGGLSKLLRSFGRIAAYRAIRQFFSALASAMREGINNLYKYSNMLGGTFAASMDRLATSVLYLKNSLGAMVSPIINAVAPAIDFLIDKFVALLNVINMVFARLTGASTFTKAKKQATSYGAAIGGAGSAAGKAAKEIEDATIGIDELNIIHEDDAAGSGGGSGGGGGVGNYADMFEEAAIDSDVADFVDRLKQAFMDGDWEGLGQIIGGKFNEIVQNIDWGGIGTKVGTGIDAALKVADSTLQTMDFKGLGSSFATFFNNAINTVDWTHLGSIVTQSVTSVLDLGIGFFSTLDTEGIGTGITQFFTGVFTAYSDWIDTVDWEQLGRTLEDKVVGLFTGLDFSLMASTLSEGLGKSVKSAFNLLKGIGMGIGEDIRKWWEDEIKGANWKETTDNLGAFIGEKLKGVAESTVIPFMRGLGFGEQIDQIEAGNGGKVEVTSPKDDRISDFGPGSAWGKANGFTYEIKIIETGETPIIEKIVNGQHEWSVDVPVRIKRLDKNEGQYKAWSDTTVGGWIKKWYMGSEILQKGVGLITSGFSTVSNFLKSANVWGDKVVSKPVGLTKYGFNTVTGFLQAAANWGGNVIKAVFLGKGSNWVGKTVAGWVNQATGGNVVKAVTLARGGSFVGRTVLKWIKDFFWGGDVVKTVQLSKKDAKGHTLWTDVGSWARQFLGGIVGAPIGLYRTDKPGLQWTNVGSWVKQFLGGVVGSPIGLDKQWRGSISDYVYDVGGDNQVTAKVNLQPGWFGSAFDTIKMWLTGSGGVIHRNGVVETFKDGGIIQAKGGVGVNHGSMIVAGEAGAEVVGHIGGRTEVMNRFQLASVMHSAITAGIQTLASPLRMIANQTVNNANGIINAVLVTADDMSRNLANLDSFGAGSYLTQRTYDDASQASRSEDGAEMTAVLRSWYETYLSPQLSKIAADTERQADKTETTVLNLDSRTVAKAVNKANKQMGYNFAT